MIELLTILPHINDAKFVSVRVSRTELLGERAKTHLAAAPGLPSERRDYQINRKGFGGVAHRIVLLRRQPTVLVSQAFMLAALAAVGRPSASTCTFSFADNGRSRIRAAHFALCGPLRRPEGKLDPL